MSFPEDDETAEEGLERMEREASYREPEDWPHGTPEERAREEFGRTGRIDDGRGDRKETRGLGWFIGGVAATLVGAGYGIYKLGEYIF
jgi:hypothetical protein